LALGDAREWLAGEDEEQLRWFEAPRPAELTDVEQFIVSCQDSWRQSASHRHWGICNSESGPLLGGVDLRILDENEVNLSYLVFPLYRRRGIARQASLMALNYAATSLGAKFAVLKMLPGNVASRSLAVSLGADYVGETPSDAGETFDVFKLSLTTQEVT
jgi:RimJ/RimL family protein N-acetyltransferase